MPQLSWNEIRSRALRFAKEWKDASSETSERQTFWNDFFEVFGIRRRMVASFESPVRKLSGHWGFIDLFWKGVLIVEHKSRGKSLDKAESQAKDYIQSLISEGRHDEAPRYIVISDFEHIALHDLDEGTSLMFCLSEFHKHATDFAFIPGYKQSRQTDVENPINVRAVEQMGELHDTLEDSGYTGHKLERFLVRILFCLFAEDTGIFDRNSFTYLIENHSREDGSDLGPLLAKLFEVLNTPEDERQKSLIEDLAAFRYVNGRLFEENLGFADLNRKMRDQLLKCCNLDWSQISPAVFGSLFQSVMEPRERRSIGAHYTSERDILKVINPLFMDDLRSKFSKVRRDPNRLAAFHESLGNLRFFDPACGCGNFLVVTYRELRRLELEVLKSRYARDRFTDVSVFCTVDVDAMHGIEINEFPALIAEVAMWLIDHQMNLELSEAFGQYVVRLPLRKTAKIVNANALRIDWQGVLPPKACSYILGNPPFIGSKLLSAEQRQDMSQFSDRIKNIGLLDYVNAWYLKAADYSSGQRIRIGFVSTNSITQGEQPGILWSELFKMGYSIQFAHRTFTWRSEARGTAHVHVVIIGLTQHPSTPRHIFDYELDEDNAQIAEARNISPYLVEGPNLVVTNRERPISDVPPIGIGNKPIDGGHYLFSTEEKEAFLQREPNAERFFKKWIGADELINGWNRWCLWLGDCEPAELRSMPECLNVVESVRAFRLSRSSPQTVRLADQPTRFHVENFPSGTFLVMPKVSSERRRYIPIDFRDSDTLVSDLCFINPTNSLFNFGILTSSMHMAWVRQVAGRLKSDFRYSAKLVYNNFPWPTAMANGKLKEVETLADAVLKARAAHPSSSLADLYDPNTMPQALSKAHEKLDRAVESCYRRRRFDNDRDRVHFLLELYQQVLGPA